MQTFIARFIRQGGELGSARVNADNTLGALLELFITQGEVTTVSVVRRPRAALLSAPITPRSDASATPVDVRADQPGASNSDERQ